MNKLRVSITSLKDVLIITESIVRRVTNKTVGIALSSGTAPGLAHIGVMKALQDQQIPIDYISAQVVAHCMAHHMHLVIPIRMYTMLIRRFTKYCIVSLILVLI